MIQFGEFNLDTKQARLFCQESEIALEPKLFELLILFINQPNTIISRQDILDHLWADSLVTDNAINKLVANLRKILSDEPKSPRYIQTVPKRGYRLICEVALLENIDSAEKGRIAIDEGSDTHNQKNGLLNKNYVKVIIALLLILCSLFLWRIINENDKQNHKYRFTMELTRAHGAEESARMHPDNSHLFYLKKHLKNSAENTRNQLWIKNIQTEKTQQIMTGKASISKIIAVTAGLNSDTSHLYYLDKKQDRCGVFQAVITHKSQENQPIQLQQTKKLFDCSGKRIKDIDYHADKKVIYYTAQPQNFWPNQIYAFRFSLRYKAMFFSC